MIRPSAFIAPGAIVLGDVTLGRDSSVWYNSVVRGDTAPITVGEASNLQDLTVVHVDAGVPCTIGRRVGVVGHRAILHGCTVEDDSLVGMGAILLNHVRVGTGSVIGAGAVLPEGTEVPPGSLVGVPGRVIRAVDDQLADRIALTWSHYVQAARDHRAGKIPRIQVSAETM